VNLILLIIYLFVLAIMFIAGLVLVNSVRTKGSIARALNMSLFLITLPRENPSAGQNQPQKQDKELISVMEQLYSSFSNMHAKGWNKFLYGEPYIALEIAVHHVGEEIHFYMAVPRLLEDVFEKQIHGIYPFAEIEYIERL